MKKFNYLISLLFITSLIIISVNSAIAQPPDPPPPPPPDGDPVGENTPIDGGLSIFLLLGGAYGTYKYKKQ
jgi:hypothetical protein